MQAGDTGGTLTFFSCRPTTTVSFRPLAKMFHRLLTILIAPMYCTVMSEPINAMVGGWVRKRAMEMRRRYVSIGSPSPAMVTVVVVSVRLSSSSSIIVINPRLSISRSYLLSSSVSRSARGHFGSRQRAEHTLAISGQTGPLGFGISSSSTRFYLYCNLKLGQVILTSGPCLFSYKNVDGTHSDEGGT